MKKTYLAPLSKVQTIEAEQMVCDSIGLSSSSASQSLGMDANDRDSSGDDEDLW